MAFSLRGNGKGGLIGCNGGVLDGESKGCCCKCCWCFSGDEKLNNGLPGGHFMEIGDWIITITDSTLLLGAAAENFCEVKFNVELEIVDGLGELDPCTTTATAELICDCTLCEDIFWEWNIEDCPPDYTGLPQQLWLGDDCEIMNCDNPTCSNCGTFTDLNAAAAEVSDPDNSVRCRCPGDTCDEGEEI